MNEAGPETDPAALDRRAGSAALRQVLELLRLANAFDPAGYRPSVLETRVESRRLAVGAATYDDYLSVLKTSPPEMGLLAESLTIKVSSFFRDPLTFEYLGERILPGVLAGKGPSGERLRIWSAGCAGGEEPYSVAILVDELTKEQNAGAAATPSATIFATDIDEKALARGREALYPASSLRNVRRGLMDSSFTQEGGSFRVVPSIARSVRFSIHDMLDRRTAAPAESIFGTFDLILCRNLLIYLETAYQEIVIRKLYRSVAEGGYLVLGETESVAEPWRGRLRRVTDCCSLYQKVGDSRRVGLAP